MHRLADEQLKGGTCYRVAAVEKGEAQKIATVKAAEAEAEAKYLQGQVSSLQTCASSHDCKPCVVGSL